MGYLEHLYVRRRVKSFYRCNIWSCLLQQWNHRGRWICSLESIGFQASPLRRPTFASRRFQPDCGLNISARVCVRFLFKRKNSKRIIPLEGDYANDVYLFGVLRDFHRDIDTRPRCAQNANFLPGKHFRHSVLMAVYGFSRKTFDAWDAWNVSYGVMTVAHDNGVERSSRFHFSF